MKNLTFLIITLYILIFPFLLSCKYDGNYIKEPLSDLEKTTLMSYVSKINQDSIDMIYEKMLAMSTQTINFSTGQAVRKTPLYIEMYSFFHNKLDNFPLLFYFILYDKRCTGEILSNVRLLLWDIAENNFKAATDRIKKQLSKHKKVVNGVAIHSPEVLFEYDIKLVKALLPYFE